MKVSDFSYELPSDRIAQVPVEPRHDAKLLVHDVAENRTRHERVLELADALDPRDLLVLNDTRVRPARLLGNRASGGAVEILLLEPTGEPDRWRALARPAGKLRENEVIDLEGGALSARCIERPGGSSFGGEWILELAGASGGTASVEARIEACGRMPLPPYIRRGRDDPYLERDRRWYQTIFARGPRERESVERELGAVAAPTAGLHFTDELLNRIEARGIARAFVTLRVGEGTFRPVVAKTTEEHEMHAERYRIPAETVEAVRACHARGGRVVAVGTTSLRALEAGARGLGEGDLRAIQGETSLFLVPGSSFRVVDALVTNFHLPGSTLLMLVAAFAGLDRTLELYREAIARGYRFYSYGDAMLLAGRPPDQE